MSMGFWWGVVFLIGQLTPPVQPDCLLCSKDCSTLPTSPHFKVGANASLVCDRPIKDFQALFSESDFKLVTSVKLNVPNAEHFNYSLLSHVRLVDISNNDLKTFSTTYLTNIQSLKLINNSLTDFHNNHSQLIDLDLTRNNIVNLSDISVNTSSIIVLNVSSNSLRSTANFTSKSLRVLNLANNAIKQVELSHLPSLKILNLTNNTIGAIQNETFKSANNLEVLYLGYNFIKQLNDFSFNLSNLIKLDLRKNEIINLSQKCFYGLNKLQFLDISNNQLKLISPRTIQYLSGLLQLSIADNPELSSHDFGFLLATRRLKTVDASKTNQIKIPSSLTRSVRYLTLKLNNISQIQCGDLDSYPLLDTLDLSNNRISFIEDDALGRLELLNTLILTNNSLKAVPHTLPTNLQVLQLSQNLIKQINTTEFSGMQQLRSLDLSFNLITTIMDNSFAQLINLNSLNLSGNPIQILSTSTFLGLRTLTQLDLSGLFNVTKCEQMLCFPIPDSNLLGDLHLKGSTVLVNQFFNDLAALKTLKELVFLDVRDSNLTDLRRDLPTLLPRLKTLLLSSNDLNCSLVQWVFTWLRGVQIDNCTFERIVKVTTPLLTTPQEASKETTTETGENTEVTLDNANDLSTSLGETTEPSTTTQLTLIQSTNEIVHTVTAYQDALNTTEPLSNEIWGLKESNVKVADALSSEIPSSHPGLFILLLLPIALVATCLLLNYSRIKKKYTREIQYEMDMEIPNISNELW